MIESKLIPCERCGTVVAMLIFAPNATDPGHFEDYARKMYPHYNHLNVPTWILGPALGEGPLIERPVDVLKVWPAREAIQRLLPAQFNSLPRSVCYEALSLTEIHIWPSGFGFTFRLEKWVSDKAVEG